MNDDVFSLSSEFLSDLQLVASSPSEESVSPGFLKDLAAVHAAALAAEVKLHVSDDELSELGMRLQNWRSKTVKEVQRLVDFLQADDPLRCPISLFRTMDYGRLETAHTRALAWLLDPRKEHGFGTKLLEALFQRVGEPVLQIEVHRVESEHLVYQGGKTRGRIDVFAEGDWNDLSGRRMPWRLVLEAKIDAQEGEAQLSRYDDWLERIEDGHAVVSIFLTPDGRMPDTATRNWRSLRFQDLAEAFRVASDELRDKPGYHYLRFYLAGVLHDVCRLPMPVGWNCNDPYPVLTYLKHVIDR